MNREQGIGNDAVTRGRGDAVTPHLPKIILCKPDLVLLFPGSIISNPGELDIKKSPIVITTKSLRSSLLLTPDS